MHPERGLVGTWSSIRFMARRRALGIPVTMVRVQVMSLFDNNFVHSSIMTRARVLEQDHEAAWLSARIPVVAVAVGVAFAFIAGVKPQAPSWMQRSGLEWSYRLATEPKRLWRRYLWGNPRFVVAALSRSR